MNITPEQASELIQNRRSLYPTVYNDQPVDDAIVNTMLENANWAPTQRLTQPWRFTVFTGSGLEKLGNFQADLYRKKAEASGTFDTGKYEKLKQKPLQCSHIIAIGMKRDPKERVHEVEEVMATACAVQNMYLTASAYGVGGYWGTGGITYYEEAKPFFGLEPDDKLLGFFYLGMPKISKWPESKRDPIEEKVHWERV
ncbi:MAG: nitroreductase [Cyclobacteriaceae bacterium]